MATATAPSPGRNGTAHGSGKPVQSIEVPLLIGRDEGDFVVYDDVPLWSEHYSKPMGQQFTEDDLHRIVSHCNSRIEDTGDYALLTIGHTNDDPDSEQPPVVGMAGPFYVGRYGNKNPKATIFAKRFACYKEDRDVVRRHPRVSVEYIHTKKAPKDGYFDVISLLGATAPEMDLGLRYEKRFAADPDLCIGRYSRTMQFVDPANPEIDPAAVARYAADSAPGGSNTYVPGDGDSGTSPRKPKSKTPKPSSANAAPESVTRHSKVEAGDGSKNTTSSASGTKDIIPQSQQGKPGQGGSSSAQSQGPNLNGQGNGTAAYGGQQGSLSQVDIAQIVAAMQPSIEDAVRRIIPAPQPPPIENTQYGQGGSDANGAAAMAGDGSDPSLAELDDDSDDDGDSFDALGDGEDDFDADSDSDDADSDSDDSPLGDGSPKHAGGMDAGGKDASASASTKTPSGKKKPPKKERFSMAANLDPNEPVEIARYKKQVGELTADRDKAAKDRDSAIAEREEYRVKYEKASRLSADKDELVEQLKSRVDVIDAERRHNARYAKLMSIANEGFKLDPDEEAQDCAAMSDEEFTRHEGRIRAKYQRIPTTFLPMDRPQHVGPRNTANELPDEDRVRYIKQAQRNVYRAKQEGKTVDYIDALRQVYEEAGKELPVNAA